MSTVYKALSLLDLFSESQPNLGPSEIARQLGWDKSTVQRYVRDLAARGILEQNMRDKTYYLGPSISRLAIMRERTNPIARELERVLSDLVAETGETCHASTYVDGELITTVVVETKIRGTRVYIDPAEPLPFHASGSGIVFLSRAPQETVDVILSTNLDVFTPLTSTTRASAVKLINKAATDGHIKMVGTYESDVVGIAAPVVGFDGNAIGAIAVAMPTARFDPSEEDKIVVSVKKAAKRVSKIYGAA